MSWKLKGEVAVTGGGICGYRKGDIREFTAKRRLITVTGFSEGVFNTNCVGACGSSGPAGTSTDFAVVLEVETAGSTFDIKRIPQRVEIEFDILDPRRHNPKLHLCGSSSGFKVDHLFNITMPACSGLAVREPPSCGIRGSATITTAPQ